MWGQIDAINVQMDNMQTRRDLYRVKFAAPEDTVPIQQKAKSYAQKAIIHQMELLGVRFVRMVITPTT